MTSEHKSDYKSDHISGRNDFPEYLLQKNQQADPANLALFTAALNNDVAGVRGAIANGAKVDFFFRPEDSKNALHVAAQHGYIAVLEELLGAGAHINAVAVSSQDTALTLAAQNGWLQAVELLLRSGAEVNAANGYGNTALHEASHLGGSADIIKLLLQSHADPNARNHKGSNPLHFLCYGSDPAKYTVEAARLLIKAGADVNARDSRGTTPFLVSCSSGRLDFIDLLLENGADPTALDENDRGAHAIAEFYNQDKVAARFSHDSPAAHVGSHKK